MNKKTMTMMSLLALPLCQQTFAGTPALVSGQESRKPNVIFVFTDQLRAQALGYAGDPNVHSPNLDRLASESINFTHNISCMPVSTPYRACMMTGQYCLTNGMFMNDIQLDPEATTIGKIFKAEGYDTGYVGKWHINGHGRSNYIPREWRQGFDYFKVLECTHNYNNSAYYDNDNPEKKYWKGYDTFAQTADAINYVKAHAHGEKPFLLFLSWGTPHSPYGTAPEKYQAMYRNKQIQLRANVPATGRKKTIEDLKGYYAHITALDKAVGDLQRAIKAAGIEENTIFVFTSDHGDMLGSQGAKFKQKPWDESIRTPFLLKYPAVFGHEGQATDLLFNTPDVLPTLLSLAGIEIPSSVEGRDVTPILFGKKKDKVKATLIECITPYGQYNRKLGGKEFRGIRTHRYTYVIDLEGPWLMYDNETDPYQLDNLIGKPGYEKLQKKLDKELRKLLKEQKDEFLPGEAYVKQWGYPVDKSGTVPYTL